MIPDGVLLASEPEPEVIEDEFFEQAEALEVGQWLEWQGEEDAWVRGKLSWRSEVSSNCIFVNRKGMKVAEMGQRDRDPVPRGAGADAGRSQEAADGSCPKRHAWRFA